jgi:hypothetical protein
MSHKNSGPLFFAGFFSILFIAGCQPSQLQKERTPKVRGEDFSIRAEEINKTTQATMEHAPRKQIQPELIRVIEDSYSKYPPRYVIPLPHRGAVAKDELRVLCRFVPGESFILAACDRQSPEGTLFVFTTHALYILSGKTVAAHLGRASWYNAFEGQPYAMALSYEQLPSFEIWDTSSEKCLKTADNQVVKISKESGIPACLDALLVYLKNPSAKAQAENEPKSQYEFIKGHTLIVPYLGPEMTEPFRESMKKLAQTHADYVCLAIMAEMETFNSPVIRWGEKANFPDEILLKAIQIARDNNLKVVLKPMVNCQDAIWRAWIEFTNDSGQQDLAGWDKWWTEYNTFILHYVRIAQQAGCEMFCLGCEMNSVEPFEQKWRELIREARKQYTGLLTYNVNHGRAQEVRFWDALDVIGMSGYYALGKYMQAAGIPGADQPDYQVTIEDLRTAWKPVREELRQVSRQWNKPLFFIECGICSAKGVSRTPWQHASPDLIYDGREQADFYQAVFEMFWDEPWFMGFTWWAWPQVLYPCQEAEKHVGFEIYCKPAEEVLKQWYAKDRPFVYQAP